MQQPLSSKKTILSTDSANNGVRGEMLVLW